MIFLSKSPIHLFRLADLYAKSKHAAEKAEGLPVSHLVFV